MSVPYNNIIYVIVKFDQERSGVVEEIKQFEEDCVKTN
jgi:hypothetical protein